MNSFPEGKWLRKNKITSLQKINLNLERKEIKKILVRQMRGRRDELSRKSKMKRTELNFDKNDEKSALLEREQCQRKL